MLRYRTVAASPLRSATATWQVIANLVTETLAKAASLSIADAEEAMSVAAPVGRLLIAGGHLDRHAVTLIAGAVHCEITTVSGTEALTIEENLNPIPGAAEATTFTIHLPTPEPLQAAVEAAAKGHRRLSTAGPHGAQAQATSAGPLIDPDALRSAVGR